MATLDASPSSQISLFCRSSTSPTKSLRNHLGLDSQPARSPLTTCKSIIPSAPFKDDKGLFFSFPNKGYFTTLQPQSQASHGPTIPTLSAHHHPPILFYLHDTYPCTSYVYSCHKVLCTT